jgi:tetratricopeptide (TPR) repeat protein
LIDILMVVAAVAAAQTGSDQPRFLTCTALVRSAPEKAVENANEWRLKGGGLLARQCLGLAYAALERWAPAATAFEQAARDAELARDGRGADLWVQSGNSWLAAGEGAKARQAFDAALASAILVGELRGEVHLDRARAWVLLGDVAAARADIDKGLALVPSDPFAWYLSSALALREEKVARAKEDIAKALALAPNEPQLLLHAGNVAGSAGEAEAALDLYRKAAQAGPNSAAGKAAQAAIAANATTPQVKPPQK